ncbi:PA14 domain-containing protein [Streptomyces sp. NPDC051940]|uniref:PA14 domain-containing protein n=1 Tax=Streptomyces sp. NPDC051940 TaxID=3155675 RepID=UPI00341DE19C
MRPHHRLSAVGAAGVVCAVAGTMLATTPAAAAVTCASPTWKAQFFGNTTFSGTPKLTTCDSAISETYGTGDPAGVSLPRDNFSVRWNLTRDFGSGGPFRFYAASQDGIRVYVDGYKKIDMWRNVSSTQSKTLNLTMPAGKHTLRVDFVAWTGSANVKFAYAPRTTSDVDKVKPFAPASVTARMDRATAKAVIAWAANKEMDLAGYKIYRREAGTSVYAYMGRTTGTTFSDLPTVPGRTYYYEVRAYDLAGNVSTGSTDVPVVRPVMTVPADMTGQGLDTGNKLTWTAVPGALKYSVERRELNGGITFLTTVTGTTWTDTAAPRSEEQWYLVRAMDGGGQYSEYAGARVIRPVAAPKDVTATAAADRAVVSWTADPATDGKYFDFHVYRSTTLPVDLSAEPVLCDWKGSYLPDGRVRYTCTDTATGPLTTYHYVVRGYDNGGRMSVPSATATVTTGEIVRDVTPPAAVKGVTATATEYGVELDWDANTEADLAKYAVYVGEVLRSDGETVCKGYEYARLNTSATGYLHTVKPDGGEHCYWIDAIDTSGNSSYVKTGTADIRFVTMPDLTPTVATPPGSPVYVSTSTGSEGVELAWGAVENATGYHVYRWDREAGRYVRLTVDAPRAFTWYTDTAAPSGTTHYYWVTAVLADGTETAPGAAWIAVKPSA